MLDIGLGEVLLIAVLALLVFGPDRLPKVASDAARTLRQVREMAAAARRELSDAAGLQDEEVTGAVRTLRGLDPRRVLDPLPPPGPAKATAGGGAAVQQQAVNPAQPRGETPGYPHAVNPGQPHAVNPGQTSSAPAGPDTSEAPRPVHVDPDWS